MRANSGLAVRRNQLVAAALSPAFAATPGLPAAGVRRFRRRRAFAISSRFSGRRSSAGWRAPSGHHGPSEHSQHTLRIEAGLPWLIRRRQDSILGYAPTLFHPAAPKAQNISRCGRMRAPEPCIGSFAQMPLVDLGRNALAPAGARPTVARFPGRKKRK